MEDIDIMLPGFRFHPTDEELVGFYLRRKVEHRPSAIELIKQLDIYKYDPWDLPKMGSGEKEWYFLCPRDRKYRNSMRPNRVTGGGFWKATGTDKPIYSSQGAAIGLKKSLVFYKGRAAKGAKTDWMMHEFRLPSAKEHSLLPSKRFMDLTIPANEAWAICRIFKKTSAAAPQRAVAQNWVSFIPPESEPVSNISFSPNSIFFSSPSNTQLDFSSYKPSNTHIAPDNIHVRLSDSHFSASSRRTVVSDYEAYFDDQLGPAPSPEAVLHNNQFSYMPQLIGSHPTAPPQ